MKKVKLNATRNVCFNALKRQILREASTASRGWGLRGPLPEVEVLKRGKDCNTKLSAGFNSQSNAMTNKATE